MQYGAELLTYKRSKPTEKGMKTINYSWYVKHLIYFVSSILMSRVILINDTAPFGIAFLIPIIMHKEDKLPIIVGLGSLLGYLSLYNNLHNIPLYLIVIISLVINSYFIESITKRKKQIIILSILIIETMAYNIFVHKYTIGINVLLSIFDVTCIFPLYFIMDYAIVCSKEFRTKHLFSNEELISMAIVVSLMISGTWGASIYGIALRNILALSFVLIISYVNGSATGASIGVAIGAIVGLSSHNMISFISVYGFCGLAVGLFKETGKWLSVLAYIISFSVIKLYSNIGMELKIIEAIITSFIFMFIPQRVYNELTLELDCERKQESFSESHIDKVKDILVGRLEGFSELLYNMSSIVNNLINNDKLLMKTKGSALVENLADRVCSTCNMNSMCWKRELHYTYSAFTELIQNYQESKVKIPEELEKKCVKRTALIKNTEDIVNNHIIREMWRNRLTEGRQILAGQINNMAVSVKEIVDEFNSNIRFNNEVEKNIRKLLSRNKIKYTDISCLEDRTGRISVKISLDACGGKQSCVKDILPFINESTGIAMCLSEDGCRINPSNNICTVSYDEMPKYHIASYVGRECKNGEKYNGDSYSFGKLKDGTYMIIISDGMGSGPEAGQESKVAVELIEKFTEAGFSKLTAINTVNSIMTLKFTEDEKFSTLDLCSVNLYSGDVEFMKVGAVSSYIKKGEKVDIIRSKTLPIGVLDRVDIDIINKKVKNGDIIVTLSDGLVDCFDSKDDRDWLMEYLTESSGGNPKEMVEEIMDIAKYLNKGKPKDDMTIVVSKVYNLY